MNTPSIVRIREDAYVAIEHLPEHRVDTIKREIEKIQRRLIAPRYHQIREFIEHCEHDFRYTSYEPVRVYEGKDFASGEFVYVPNGIWQFSRIRCIDCGHEETFGHLRCPLCLGQAEAEIVPEGDVTYRFQNYHCPRCEVKLSYEAEDWG